MIGKDLVTIQQLPLIPIDWDYEKSITYLKPKIEHWKQETYEIACELHIANEILSTGGRPKKSVPNGTVSFRNYCEEVWRDGESAIKGLISA